MLSLHTLVAPIDAMSSVGGLDLIPAGVAATVLIALGVALVITSLRRKDSGRDTTHRQ
ncbi:hypothetical protein [Naasia lichenicola]|uniref:hypothetical protein n=1 Tax=Naasia lichenicola TaxID=2565933 RepID=UPI00130EAD90|nr:hypothetical protein [Naasia lichenicola]